MLLGGSACIAGPLARACDPPLPEPRLRKRKCPGRTDIIFGKVPPNEPAKDCTDRKIAKPCSIPKIEITAAAGMPRLQNDQKRLARRRIQPRWRNLLLPGLRGRYRLHMPRCRQTGFLAPGSETNASQTASRRAALGRAGATRRTERRTRLSRNRRGVRPGRIKEAPNPNHQAPGKLQISRIKAGAFEPHRLCPPLAGRRSVSLYSYS